jgi:hypothetical protein
MVTTSHQHWEEPEVWLNLRLLLADHSLVKMNHGLLVYRTLVTLYGTL